MGTENVACTVRRKYAAGGDIWLADAKSLDEAREWALQESLRFEHGAVYVAHRVNGKTVYGPCFAQGLPSAVAWWAPKLAGYL